jgi:uridine kinase
MIPDCFKPTPFQHEDVFNSLKEQVFSNRKPVDGPLAIIIGGQPEAGKTNLILASKVLQNDNCIVINGDNYRERHPWFSQIAYQNDKNITEYTDPNVRDWTSRF